MREFLLFNLYAPLAAFGDSAVGSGGTRRSSGSAPSKSQTIGLIACAFGIDRSQTEWHQAAASQWGMAVREDCSGVMEVDYHTAETLSGARGTTRRLTKQHPDAHSKTNISWREWRSDSFHTCALWERRPNAGPPSLKDAAQALNAPANILFLGRKAGAFGLPLRAETVQAETLEDAFAQRILLPPELDVLTQLLRHGAKSPLDEGGATVLFDTDAPGGPDAHRRVPRRRHAAGQEPRRAAVPLAAHRTGADRAGASRLTSTAAMLHLTRATLRHSRETSAFMADSRAARGDSPAGIGHHLVWTLFEGPERDFLWRYAGRDAFWVLSQRLPSEERGILSVLPPKPLPNPAGRRGTHLLAARQPGGAAHRPGRMPAQARRGLARPVHGERKRRQGPPPSPEGCHPDLRLGVAGQTSRSVRVRSGAERRAHRPVPAPPHQPTAGRLHQVQDTGLRRPPDHHGQRSLPMRRAERTGRMQGLRERIAAAAARLAAPDSRPRG